MADREISELTAASTPLSGSEEIHISQGGNSRRVALTDVAAISTGAMLKSEYDPNADSIISVANGGTNSATAAGARTNLGLGTLAVQNAATVAITGGSITGITDITVADGGTGASTASGARTNLGLVIGTNVMAYSANLAGFAATTVTNVQNRVNHTGTQLAATISDFSTAADLRIAAAVGVTVQAYDALLTSVSGLSLTAGDIVYATGADAVAVLGIGESGQVLAVSDDGIPAWGTELSVGGLLADNNLSDVDDAGAARSNLSAPVYVADRTALKALDVTKDLAAIIYDEGGRNGTFTFDSSDLSTEVAADTQEGIYVAPTSETDGSAGAWVRKYDGAADIKWWGPTGDGTTNDRPAFQGAYDTLPDKSTLHITRPETSYTLTSAVTLSGEKRLQYVTDLDCAWTAAGDFNDAVGNEQTNSTGLLWRQQLHYTDYKEGSGGILNISARRKPTDDAVGYQWDAVRIHAVQEDESSTGVNKGVIGLGIFTYGHASNPNAAIWGLNAYVHQPAGGDSTMRGVEANLDNDGTLVKEPLSNFNKLGFFSTTKSGACTAAYFAGKGLGDGWYKGYFLNQDALVDDADSRAFEYEDLFEVMRDGRVLVGKGVSSTFGAAGIELSPAGSQIMTATGVSASMLIARTDTGGGSKGLFTLSARALDSGGGTDIYAQIDINCIDGTASSEDGTVIISTIRNGTLAQRAAILSGLVVGPSSLIDQGASTINTNAYYSGGNQISDSSGNIRFRVVTAAALGAVGNVVNTTNKVAGAAVWDDTNDRLMIAAGAAAAAPWRDAIGTNTITPA